MKTTIRHAAGVMLLALLTISCSGKSATNAGTDADSSACEQTADACDATADVAEAPEELKAYAMPLEIAAGTLLGTYPETPDGFWGITGSIEGKSYAEALQSVGYTLLDIDQNGTKELVIASNANPSDYPSCKGNMIFLIYDQHEGKPRKIVSGHYRNAWFLSRPDRELLNIGSVSAACSIHALYDYINGELTCRDNWYSGLNEEGDHIFYHSYEATTDPAKGEHLSFTMDDFISHEDELAAETRRIKLTPFADLRPVTVRQEGTDMVFTVSAAVRDFTTVKLSNPKYADNGVTFTEKPMQAYGTIQPGKPVKAKMPINGDEPEYAISFTDPLGEKVKMHISISGEDGSVVLRQYNKSVYPL